MTAADDVEAFDRRSALSSRLALLASDFLSGTFFEKTKRKQEKRTTAQRRNLLLEMMILSSIARSNTDRQSLAALSLKRHSKSSSVSGDDDALFRSNSSFGEVAIPASSVSICGVSLHFNKHLFRCTLPPPPLRHGLRFLSCRLAFTHSALLLRTGPFTIFSISYRQTNRHEGFRRQSLELSPQKQTDKKKTLLDNRTATKHPPASLDQEDETLSGF